MQLTQHFQAADLTLLDLAWLIGFGWMQRLIRPTRTDSLDYEERENSWYGAGIHDNSRRKDYMDPAVKRKEISHT